MESIFMHNLTDAICELVSIAEDQLTREHFNELDNAGADIIDCLEALQAYREEEKSGAIVRLPVKLGDTVYTSCCMSGWYFRAKDAPYSAKVVFIGLNNSEEYGGGLFNVELGRGYMLQFSFSDIGKTVFLTREEAEAAKN
jgi:hypothetical protein